MIDFAIGFVFGAVVSMAIIEWLIERRRWKRQERELRSRLGDPGGEPCPCGSTYGACLRCPPWRYTPPDDGGGSMSTRVKQFPGGHLIIVGANVHAVKR